MIRVYIAGLRLLALTLIECCVNIIGMIYTRNSQSFSSA